MRIVAAVVSLFIANVAASADDNCQNAKESLIREYPVAHWSHCFYTTSDAADREGALLCALAMAEGATVTAVGHRVVANWTTVFAQRIDLPNTYVGFCGAIRLPGPKYITKSEREIREEIQKGLDKIGSQR